MDMTIPDQRTFYLEKKSISKCRSAQASLVPALVPEPPAIVNQAPS
jgi:hypothetical protein